MPEIDRKISGFTQITNDFINNSPNLSGWEFKLFCILLSFPNGCFLSNLSLAKRMGCSEGSFRRVAAGLMRKKIITRKGIDRYRKVILINSDVADKAKPQGVRPRRSNVAREHSNVAREHHSNTKNNKNTYGVLDEFTSLKPRLKEAVSQVPLHTQQRWVNRGATHPPWLLSHIEDLVDEHERSGLKYMKVGPFLTRRMEEIIEEWRSHPKIKLHLAETGRLHD